MKTTGWNLIVQSPHSPRLQKICISSKAARILIAAVVFACLFTAVLALISPHFRVNDSDRARLVAENQMLKIENKNLTFKIRRLDDQVGRMEEGSQRDRKSTRELQSPMYLVCRLLLEIKKTYHYSPRRRNPAR